MFKTIVVPIDGSTGSERVLLFAEHLARRDQAQIIVVHAYELPEVYSWTDAYAALAAQYERTATEVTQDAVDALQAAGVPVTADVRLGNPVDNILDAVRIHQADLIVMGSRGQKRDSVTEALLGMGSVSSAVLLRAYCPVLVVP
jgi:nucleotide-binding universal stress UspA family protein